MKALVGGFVCVAMLAAMGSASWAQDTSMSFFVTSQGPGDGANLGGLEGADAHCQKLAEAAGAGGKTWRAISAAAAPMHATGSAAVPGTTRRAS